MTILPADLTTAQAAIAPLFSNTVTITREVDTPDGQGGYTKVASVPGTFPGRISPLVRRISAGEVPIADQIQGKMLYLLHYPLWVGQGTTGIAFVLSDVLQINGANYNVQNIVDPGPYALERTAVLWRQVIPQGSA